MQQAFKLLCELYEFQPQRFLEFNQDVNIAGSSDSSFRMRPKQAQLREAVVCRQTWPVRAKKLENVLIGWHHLLFIPNRSSKTRIALSSAIDVAWDRGALALF